MLLIRAVQLGQRHARRRFEPIEIIARAQVVILGARDQLGHRLDLVGRPSTAGRVPQHRQRVGAVQNGEARIYADAGSVAPEQPVAERVERADVRAGGGRKHRGRPLAHLIGRLVGEGDRQHGARRNAAPLGQVGDLGGDRPRLAGAGSRQDEQRAAPVLHGAPLRLVQHRQVACERITAGRIGAAPARRRFGQRAVVSLWRGRSRPAPPAPVRPPRRAAGSG